MTEQEVKNEIGKWLIENPMNDEEVAPENVLLLRLQEYYSFLELLFVLDPKHDFLNKGRLKKSDLSKAKKVYELLNHFHDKLHDEYEQLNGTKGDIIKNLWNPKDLTDDVKKKIWKGGEPHWNDIEYENVLRDLLIDKINEFSKSSNNSTKGATAESLQVYYATKKTVEVWKNAAAECLYENGVMKEPRFALLNAPSGYGPYWKASSTLKTRRYTKTEEHIVPTFDPKLSLIQVCKGNIASLVDGAAGLPGGCSDLIHGAKELQQNKPPNSIKGVSAKSYFEIGNINMKFQVKELDDNFIIFRIKYRVKHDSGIECIIKIIRQFTHNGDSKKYEFEHKIEDIFGTNGNRKEKRIEVPKEYRDGNDDNRTMYWWANKYNKANDEEKKEIDIISPARKPFCDFGQSLTMFLKNGGYHEGKIWRHPHVIPPLKKEEMEKQRGFPVISVHNDRPAVAIASFLIMFLEAGERKKNLNIYAHTCNPVVLTHREVIRKVFVFVNSGGNLSLQFVIPKGPKRKHDDIGPSGDVKDHKNKKNKQRRVVRQSSRKSKKGGKRKSRRKRPQTGRSEQRCSRPP